MEDKRDDEALEADLEIEEETAKHVTGGLRRPAAKEAVTREVARTREL